MQPGNQSVVEGQTATFSVSVAGTDPAGHEKYGALYNWHTVNTGKLAPATGGWRVPSNTDWDTLQNYLVTHGIFKKHDTPGINGKYVDESFRYAFTAKQAQETPVVLRYAESEPAHAYP